MRAEELLNAGRLEECLAALQTEVRANPADSRLRVFLFQLLVVTGDLERAMTQLNVAADLSPDALLMVHACRSLLNCEAFRNEVFDGQRGPLIFGEPEEWIGWLVQANILLAGGKTAASAKLREQAYNTAPAWPGSIDGTRFEWLADADSRLGPVLEAVVEGRYYWVPLNRIAGIDLEIPTDLRDLVWLPANFTWRGAGTSVGFVPTRYPGPQALADDSLRLARKTQWDDRGYDTYLGSGQRMLVTDQGEYPLLEVRRIVFDQEAATSGGAS